MSAQTLESKDWFYMQWGVGVQQNLSAAANKTKQLSHERGAFVLVGVSVEMLSDEGEDGKKRNETKRTEPNQVNVVTGFY